MEPTHNNCIHCEVCDYQDVPCEPNICPCYEHNKSRYFRGYNFACFEIIKTLKEIGAITQETADRITKSLPNILRTNMTKNCGILDENYNLTEAYKDIFVSKEEYNPITKQFVVRDYDAYLRLLQEIEKGDAE